MRRLIHMPNTTKRKRKLIHEPAEVQLSLDLEALRNAQKRFRTTKLENKCVWRKISLASGA